MQAKMSGSFGKRKFVAVVADGFHRAGHEGFAAERSFFGCFGLFSDVRIAVLIISGEIGRRNIAADIAVDALIIDVVLARRVIRKFVSQECHTY